MAALALQPPLQRNETGMISYPFNDVLAEADKLIAKGSDVHQQFTCGKCGVKQTMEDANTFYISGRCEECNHVTDLKVAGCNMMTVTRLR